MKKSTLLLQILCLLALSDIKSVNADSEVCFQSSLGEYCIELYDSVAPITVSNFLEYVNSGAYNNSIIHRSVPGFVVQSGGFALDNDLSLNAISTNTPIKNEFQLSNTRGTIAMAKLSGNPDSATSQWFINLADNSAILDPQNGGFTVFGKVVDNGMDVIDSIATLPTYNLGGELLETPLQNYISGSQIQTDNLIFIYSAVALIFPGQVSLTSPSGSIEDTTPIFLWDKEDNSTWYQLLIRDNSEELVHIKWYKTADICSGDDCSVVFESGLPGGSYTWWVQTYNNNGNGEWSDSMTFTVNSDFISTPSAAALVSPDASATSPITYTWDAVSDSTWYQLWVNDSTGNKIKEWYTSAQANCEGSSTCSVTNSTTLTGSSTWWILTYNDNGNGEWSSGMNFTVSAGDTPGVPTLTSPSGNITETTPTYVWNAVSSSTWYQLWVNDSAGTAIQKWYTASEAGCDSGTGNCSITSTETLESGSCTWWLRGWNDDGNGAWSDGVNFTVSD